jgi:hypothetical protein
MPLDLAQKRDLPASGAGSGLVPLPSSGPTGGSSFSSTAGVRGSAVERCCRLGPASQRAEQRAEQPGSAGPAQQRFGSGEAAAGPLTVISHVGAIVVVLAKHLDMEVREGKGGEAAALGGEAAAAPSADPSATKSQA